MSLQTVPLFKVCEIIMGQAPVGSSYNENGEGLALIAGAGDFGQTTPEPKKYTTEASKISRIDDLILCIRATIGDLNWSDKEYCLGRGVAGLRPIAHMLDKNYLWHFIGANKSQLSAKGTGSTFKQVSRSHIAEWEIPLPPLAEQKRIAAILDKADAIRRKRQQAIQLADEFLRAVFLDMFGDPVTNPKGWEVKPLIELIDTKRPITYGILKPGDDVDGGIPYVRVVDMKDGVVLSNQVRRTTSEIAQQYKRSSLKPGDVLLSIRGHVGRLAIVPNELEGANITQDTARLATNEKCLGLYLFACLQTARMQNEMQRYVKGAAVKGINLADVKELKIPVPPMSLQRKIEGRIKIMTSGIKKLEKSENGLENNFRSLSKKAFSGEL